MPHITYIVTDPMTVKIYLKPQVKLLLSYDWQVSVICGGKKELLPDKDELHGADVYHVRMRREIDPIRDTFALAQLSVVLRRLKPDIVNAGTPKAGLIGMIASRIVHVPVRIYQLHGLRLETATGWKRRLFSLAERTACSCAQTVLCVSRSLQEKVLELGICEAQKLVVLGSGSCVGISLTAYRPTPERLATAARLRESLQIPAHAPVVGFIGRITKDKGIEELLDAFSLISEKRPRTYLLLVGPFEDGDPITDRAREEILENPYIRHVEWTDDPRPYFHLMNVFVLPTYREGLPGVLLEAIATQTPIVATRATGVVDVVEHEQTGLLSSVGDSCALAQNALRALEDPVLGQELTRQAQRKVEAEFSRDQVLQRLESFYRESVEPELSGVRE